MNKKILNFCLTLIVVLVVIIFCAVFYYMYSSNKATNSIYEDVGNANLVETDIANTVAEKPNEEETNTEALSINDENIKKIIPFTGAFPGVDIIPFISEKENKPEFSNEQILRLGFSKVTKNDWADSYIGEGEKVSIPASLLDGCIKNIFGQSVQYKKANFSNSNYSIDKDFTSHTSSYNAEYNSATDSYIIEHIGGDGIDENFVHLLEPTTSKIRGKLEVEIPYVYVVYGDKPVSGVLEDGTETGGFEYIIYGKYDYSTKAFSEEIGRYNDLEDFVVNAEEFSQAKAIEDIARTNLAKVPKLTLIYESNAENTEYVLKEIKN